VEKFRLKLHNRLSQELAKQKRECRYALDNDLQTFY